MIACRFHTSVIALLAGLSLAPAPVHAHPHIFVTTAVAIVYREGAVTALEIAWTFDELYSVTQLQEADTDNDGSTTDAELTAFARVTIESLKDLDYYTSAKLDQLQLKFSAPMDYAFERKDDNLVLRFTLLLEQPVSTVGKLFTFAIRDSEFASAFTPEPSDPLVIKGATPAGCQLSATLPPNEATEIQRLGELFPLGGPEFGLSAAVVGSLRCPAP